MNIQTSRSKRGQQSTIPTNQPHQPHQHQQHQQPPQYNQQSNQHPQHYQEQQYHPAPTHQRQQQPPPQHQHHHHQQQPQPLQQQPSQLNQQQEQSKSRIVITKANDISPETLIHQDTSQTNTLRVIKAGHQPKSTVITTAQYFAVDGATRAKNLSVVKSSELPQSKVILTSLTAPPPSIVEDDLPIGKQINTSAKKLELGQQQDNNQQPQQQQPQQQPQQQSLPPLTSKQQKKLQKQQQKQQQQQQAAQQTQPPSQQSKPLGLIPINQQPPQQQHQYHQQQQSYDQSTQPHQPLTITTSSLQRQGQQQHQYHDDNDDNYHHPQQQYQQHQQYQESQHQQYQHYQQDTFSPSSELKAPTPFLPTISNQIRSKHSCTLLLQSAIPPNLHPLITTRTYQSLFAHFTQYCHESGCLIDTRATNFSTGVIQYEALSNPNTTTPERIQNEWIKSIRNEFMSISPTQFKHHPLFESQLTPLAHTTGTKLTTIAIPTIKDLMIQMKECLKPVQHRSHEVYYSLLAFTRVLPSFHERNALHDPNYWSSLVLFKKSPRDWPHPFLYIPIKIQHTPFPNLTCIRTSVSITLGKKSTQYSNHSTSTHEYTNQVYKPDITGSDLLDPFWWCKALDYVSKSTEKRYYEGQLDIFCDELRSQGYTVHNKTSKLYEQQQGQFLQQLYAKPDFVPYKQQTLAERIKSITVLEPSPNHIMSNGVLRNVKTGVPIVPLTQRGTVMNYSNATKNSLPDTVMRRYIAASNAAKIFIEAYNKPQVFKPLSTTSISLSPSTTVDTITKTITTTTSPTNKLPPTMIIYAKTNRFCDQLQILTQMQDIGTDLSLDEAEIESQKRRNILRNVADDNDINTIQQQQQLQFNGLNNNNTLSTFHPLLASKTIELHHITGVNNKEAILDIIRQIATITREITTLENDKTKRNQQQKQQMIIQLTNLKEQLVKLNTTASHLKEMLQNNLFGTIANQSNDVYHLPHQPKRTLPTSIPFQRQKIPIAEYLGQTGAIKNTNLSDLSTLEELTQFLLDSHTYRLSFPTIPQYYGLAMYMDTYDYYLQSPILPDGSVVNDPRTGIKTTNIDTIPIYSNNYDVYSNYSRPLIDLQSIRSILPYLTNSQFLHWLATNPQYSTKVGVTMNIKSLYYYFKSGLTLNLQSHKLLAVAQHDDDIDQDSDNDTTMDDINTPKIYQYQTINEIISTLPNSEIYPWSESALEYDKMVQKFLLLSQSIQEKVQKRSQKQSNKMDDNDDENVNNDNNTFDEDELESLQKDQEEYDFYIRNKDIYKALDRSSWSECFSHAFPDFYSVPDEILLGKGYSTSTSTNTTHNDTTTTTTNTNTTQSTSKQQHSQQQDNDGYNDSYNDGYTNKYQNSTKRDYTTSKGTRSTLHAVEQNTTQQSPSSSYKSSNPRSKYTTNTHNYDDNNTTSNTGTDYHDYDRNTSSSINDKNTHHRGLQPIHSNTQQSSSYQSSYNNSYDSRRSSKPYSSSSSSSSSTSNYQPSYSSGYTNSYSSNYYQSRDRDRNNNPPNHFGGSSGGYGSNNNQYGSSSHYNNTNRNNDYSSRNSSRRDNNSYSNSYNTSSSSTSHNQNTSTSNNNQQNDDVTTTNNDNATNTSNNSSNSSLDWSSPTPKKSTGFYF